MIGQTKCLPCGLSGKRLQQTIPLSIASPKPLLKKPTPHPQKKTDSAPQPSLLCHACSLTSSASSLSPTLRSCILFPVPYPMPASCGLSNMMLGSHTRFWVPNKSGIEVQGSIHHSIEEGCHSNQAAALCPVWACMVIHKIPVAFTRILLPSL